uniref:Ovule protein n=1 Tax=Ascaris lumbricoides TaxID=6252 RepID=A0A0M3HTP4_ASCLU
MFTYGMDYFHQMSSLCSLHFANEATPRVYGHHSYTYICTEKITEYTEFSTRIQASAVVLTMREYFMVISLLLCEPGIPFFGHKFLEI